MGIALCGPGLSGLPAAAQVPAGSERVVALAESFLRKLERVMPRVRWRWWVRGWRQPA
jgi:hypothetical protein